MKKKLKIILLDDHPELGKKYEAKLVSAGYFRNFLLPNGLAELATYENVKNLKERKAYAEEKKQKLISDLKKKSSALKGAIVKFKAKTTKEEKIFGSISARDIEQNLEEKGFIGISINLKTSIKKLGEYEVEADFGEGIKISVKVIVEGE